MRHQCFFGRCACFPQTELIRITSDIFIGRKPVGHLALATTRRYRMVSSDPLGVVTPNEPLTPNIWESLGKFTVPPAGAFISKYCMIFLKNSPTLPNACMLLAVGTIGSSIGFTSAREKGRTHESLRDLAYYSFSWLVLFLCPPAVLLTAGILLEEKVATASRSGETEKSGKPVEVAPGTETPSETEVLLFMEYRVHLLMGKYRLIPDYRCSETTNAHMNLREFDIPAHVVGGTAVSVSLPMAPMCTIHKAAYTAHVTDHTCSSADCVEWG